MSFNPLPAVTRLPDLLEQPDLRILIAAADPLTRAGLVALLNTQSGIMVAGQTAIEGIGASIAMYMPDAIVWEAGTRTAQVADALIGLDDPPPVLMLITEAEDAAALWLAGVRGIIRRSARISEIVAGLTALTAGLTVLDPAISEAVVAPRDRMLAVNGSTISTSRDRLTARETEVLHALTEGLPNKAIAQKLGISDSTVKFHINAIMGKLGAQSRTEAVVRATRLGLIVL